jgi:CubicO group peptidase (beta-lactamase class C family)
MIKHAGQVLPALFIRPLIVFAIILIAFCNRAVAQSKEIVFTSGRSINVIEFNNSIRKSMDAVGITGLSLAVIDNDKVVFSNSYGYKDKGGGKINGETIFEACSLSKSFFAYLVYQLVEEGKLDLDKPIYEYWENGALKNDPRNKAITSRMILSHCSGIENWKDMNNPDSLEIVANPGERYVYSGEGYHYLAVVVQNLMKQSYEQAIIKKVLEPLKLNRTYTTYSADGRYPSNYAIGHDIMGNAVLPKRKNTSPVPAAGMHTTANDYANLIIHFFNSKNFSAAGRKNLVSPVIRLHKQNPSVYYGPGFEVIITPGDTIISHGGANQGFRNVVFYSLKHKRGFVLLTNHEWGKKLVAQISKATVDLDIETRLGDYDFEDQFPDNATRLLNIYKKAGFETMMKQVDVLQQKKQLKTRTLPDLSYALRYDKNDNGARLLLEKNIACFPGETNPYVELGYYYYESKSYDSAYRYFSRIGDIHGDTALISYQVKLCERMLAEEKKSKQRSSDTGK